MYTVYQHKNKINGKVYRNLEGQVEYLTHKWDDLQDQIDDIRSHLTHYIVVDSFQVSWRQPGRQKRDA